MIVSTRFWLAALTLACFISESAFAQDKGSMSQSIEKTVFANELALKDIDGQEHKINSGKGRAFTVLVFINTTCPIANAYHPALARLKKEFRDDAFDFVLVHADPDVTEQAAREHQRSYEIEWSIALDPEQRIAKLVIAKVTPEAFVIDSQGHVVYRGRIDDRHQDYGRKRPAPTSNDLRDVLVAIRDGQPIVTPETKAIGCVIRFTSNKPTE